MVGAASVPLIVNQNDVASAQFWKAPARESQEPLCRELSGEILVPKDLPPGCEILNFRLQVRGSFTKRVVAGLTAE